MIENDYRFLCSDLVAVEWHPSAGECHRTPAILDDISKRGACLQIEHPIPAETMVKLICGRSELKGNVRSCRYQHGIGYRIGITFAEDCTWSKERYRPSHLLDPTDHPPCGEGKSCPHSHMASAASGATAEEKVRKVAREVARMCRNLDLDLVTNCYRQLYTGHRGDQLLAEFIDAYYDALQTSSRHAGSRSPDP